MNTCSYKNGLYYMRSIILNLRPRPKMPRPIPKSTDIVTTCVRKYWRGRCNNPFVCPLNTARNQ